MLNFSRTVVHTAYQTRPGDLVGRITGKLAGGRYAEFDFAAPVAVVAIDEDGADEDAFGGELPVYRIALSDGSVIRIRTMGSNVYTVAA